ncbi:hypothetical protein B0H14DRAFT_3465086 [Mycena olivaceomarginata]|nr:hypothetical protein B0H14DRAFT_3465086 [Mycena olivaceomarginata]
MRFSCPKRPPRTPQSLPAFAPTRIPIPSLPWTARQQPYGRPSAPLSAPTRIPIPSAAWPAPPTTQDALPRFPPPRASPVPSAAVAPPAKTTHGRPSPAPYTLSSRTSHAVRKLADALGVPSPLYLSSAASPAVRELADAWFVYDIDMLSPSLARAHWNWTHQGSRRRAAMKAEEYASEEHTVSVKDAHAAYRVKNREILAFKARVRRQNVFIAKHGIQAHHDRIAKERASADAAWQAQLAENERQREARREARKAARQSSSTTVN